MRFPLNHHRGPILSSRFSLRGRRCGPEIRLEARPTSPILNCLRCWVSFEDCLVCFRYRSAALRDQWRLPTLGDRRAWQGTQDWRLTAFWPRPAIALTSPDTRGFGSPYRVRFDPFAKLPKLLTQAKNEGSTEKPKSSRYARGKRLPATKLLTKDEARRIAVNIESARLSQSAGPPLHVYAH